MESIKAYKCQPVPSGWEIRLDKFNLGTKDQIAKNEWS